MPKLLEHAVAETLVVLEIAVGHATRRDDAVEVEHLRLIERHFVDALNALRRLPADHPLRTAQTVG
jgi:hypothetical protein